jgi:hypothetical protein
MTNRLTENDKCFTPEELERQRKAKDREVINGVKGMKVKKRISEEEAGEFLKLIKHNEYIVVEQLKKTHAKISLMSLILSFEPHHNALQKVLNGKEKM